MGGEGKKQREKQLCKLFGKGSAKDNLATLH